MNTDTWPDWAERIDNLIWTIEGEAAVRALRDAWHPFSADDRVRVTFWGVYNSGKSSLIRRLLAEEGTDVPASVRVSAARGQFDIDEVPSGDFVYVDTPGLDAGDLAHDERANAAAALTDVLVVVTTPLLRPSDATRIADAIGRKPPRFPARGLIVVINQLDEAGVDPRHDRDAYERLVQTKRQAVVAALAAAGVPEPPSIHTVSADAWRRNARKPCPVREDYAASRTFDGIAELVDELRGTVAERGALRAAAAVRHWSLGARRAITAAEQECAVLETELLEAVAVDKQVQVWLARLESLASASASQLRTAVHRELKSVMRSVEHGGVSTADAHLEEAISAWFTQARQNIAGLASQFDADTTSFTGGGASATARSALEQARAVAPRPPAPDDNETTPGFLTPQRLTTLSSEAGEWIRGAFESGFGLTVEMAEPLIAEFDAAVNLIPPEGRAAVFSILNGPRVSGLAEADRHVLTDLFPESGALVSLLERVPALGTPERAQSIARWLKNTKRFSAAAPVAIGVILEGVKLFTEHSRADQQVRAAAEREKLLNQLVDDIVDAELGTGATNPTGWAAMLDSVRGAITAIARSTADRQTAQQRKNELAAASRSLTDLLDAR